MAEQLEPMTGFHIWSMSTWKENSRGDFEKWASGEYYIGEELAANMGVSDRFGWMQSETSGEIE